MALGRRQRSREVVAQAALFVVVATLALTAGFLGLVALLTGAVAGIQNRLPFYVLAMAIAFVGSILTLEGEFDAGREVLEIATLAAIVTALAVTLAGEGVAFSLQDPGRVFSSQLVFYFLAAGLMGTGLGYWGLRHWDEFVTTRGPGL
ncbi:hypothetical protein ACKVMT_15085 [Halobacteriales archaeon Cl-PHB]